MRVDVIGMGCSSLTAHMPNIQPTKDTFPEGCLLPAAFPPGYQHSCATNVYIIECHMVTMALRGFWGLKCTDGSVTILLYFFFLELNL
jgi:hypothetical protein